MSPKLQLDGSLTMSNSSSLQASPRSLLPSLLPGPGDKLTPKGPGQVCVHVCGVLGNWWLAAGKVDSVLLHPFFTDSVLSQVLHVPSGVVSAFHVP